MTIRFKILGPLEAWQDRRLLDLGRPRQRAVLASLLVTPNHAVSLDELVEHSPAEPRPAGSIDTLYCYVSGLRRILDVDTPLWSRDRVIRRRGPGYLLAVEPEQVDGWEFERSVLEGRRLVGEGRFEEAAERVRSGLSLWRAEPYQEFREYRLCAEEANRLGELYVLGVETRCEAELRLGGDLDAVTGELGTLAVRFPARERLSRLLMQALYRAGYQADALRVFERTRRALSDLSGVKPGRELQRIFVAILRQDDEVLVCE